MVSHADGFGLIQDIDVRLTVELGRKSIREMLPMQLGDVTQTYADIKAAKLDLGFAPITTIEQGLPQFVAWFRSYHGV